MTTITLPIAPEIFWTLVSSLALLVTIFVAYLLLDKSKVETPWMDATRRQLGLTDLNAGLFAVATLLYVTLFLLLFSGLLMLIWDILELAILGEFTNKDFHKVFPLIALTTVLGAVVALPITMTRLRLTRQQTRTAAESLFNDKINAALEDLYSRRQFTERGDNGKPKKDVWQDDITRRNAAIGRLERLADEDPAFALPIAKDLAIYVRELSKENEPEVPPETEDFRILRAWARKLTVKRTDMENAVQTIGRLIPNHNLNGADIDLRDTNLQAFDLQKLNLEKVQLWDAHLQWAILMGAKLQGAELWSAKLQGASLWGAKFDASTSFSGSNLQAVAVKYVDFTNVPQIARHLDQMFGDASVQLPEGVSPPDHWPKEDLEPIDFHDQWRAWQRSIGFDPDNPDTA